MTIQSIRARLAEKGKSVSKPQLYRYFKACKPPIRPVGAVRQKPQQYPNDTAERIESILGLRVVSMTQLREARRVARRGR